MIDDASIVNDGSGLGINGFQFQSVRSTKATAETNSKTRESQTLPNISAHTFKDRSQAINGMSSSQTGMTKRNHKQILSNLRNPLGSGREAVAREGSESRHSNKRFSE